MPATCAKHPDKEAVAFATLAVLPLNAHRTQPPFRMLVCHDCAVAFRRVASQQFAATICKPPTHKEP